VGNNTLHDVTPLTVQPEVFSDGFSEGQPRDIKGGFPSDSDPYAERYDYWSDSDLEDESEAEDEDPAEEDGCEPQPSPKDSPDPTTVPEHPSPRPSLIDTNEAQDADRSASSSSLVPASLVNFNHRPDDNVTRAGKVAIVRDIGAITLVRPSANRFAWLTGGPQV
jgi:hypothetical protein